MSVGVRYSHSMRDDGPSAIVQEANCSDRVVVLQVRSPGRTTRVIVGAGREASGVGLLPHGVRKDLWGGKLPPGCVRRRAMEDALAKARILAIFPDAVVLVPWSARPENPEAHPRPPADATSRLRVHNGRVWFEAFPFGQGGATLVDLAATEHASLETRGLAIAKALATDAIAVHREVTQRTLEKARSRIARRGSAIREDLARMADAERLAAQASWLIAEANRAPRGTSKLLLTDWSTGQAVSTEVPIDPSKSPRAQVDAMFKRAKRLKLGRRVTEERLAQTEAQAEAVERCLARVRESESVAAIDDIVREAKRAAPRDVLLSSVAGAASSKTMFGGTKNSRASFRTFVARSGHKILVGKGAGDNDVLTLKIATPHDLWLHAKDRSGAHVIVPLAKSQSCSAEDLVDAAHLAAHFGDARGERVVDIQYTPKKYLRKPKGSAPGAVVVTREKVLALRVDGVLLAQLLEREEV